MRRCVMALYMCVSICVWSDNQTVGPAVCLHLLVCACMSLCRATLVISSATAKIRRSNCGTWGFPPQCKHSRSVRLSGNSGSGINMGAGQLGRGQLHLGPAGSEVQKSLTKNILWPANRKHTTLLLLHQEEHLAYKNLSYEVLVWLSVWSYRRVKNIRISMQEFLKPKGPMGQFCALWCFDAVRQVRLII